jgi:hypothetical protein
MPLTPLGLTSGHDTEGMAMRVPPMSKRGFGFAPTAAHSLPHRTLTILLCLAALLLWAVAAPTAAAFANAPDHAERQGPPDRAGGTETPDRADASEQHRSADGRADERAEAPAPRRDDDDEDPRSERAEEVRGGQQGEQQRNDRADERGGEAGERAEPAGDPNRGTIKVRSTGEQTWPPRHEPHLDACEFWIHLHGFDEDEREVRIYAWAPTGDKQLVHEGSVSLTDARGNDYSGIYPPTPDAGLTLADLDADPAWPDEYEAHEQQGWHLRVEVEGPKHKMLWLDCPVDEPEAPEEEPAPEPDAAPEDEPVVDDIGLIVEDEEQFGVGGALPGDEAAVLGLILAADEGVGGAEPAADVEVAGVAGGADVLPVSDANVLPVTGASLVWLAAVGLLFSVVGARMAATSRTTTASH